MAAQVVTGNINIGANFAQVDSTGLVQPITAAANAALNVALSNATGATQAIDTLYGAQLTLTGAATHINLHAAVDILGNSVVFARVRFWWVYVVTLTAGYIVNVYTRSGTNPVTWLPTATSSALWAPPGGVVMGIDPYSTTTNGYVVGSGANDFTLDPGANTVVCNVIIAGNSGA